MALYGNSGPSESLYGAQRPAQEPLSKDNQDMAQQLSLPGHESQAAGSQQAAQSDWANFEDVFNKNQGYAKSSLENAKNKVALAGVDYSGVSGPGTRGRAAADGNSAPKGSSSLSNGTVGGPVSMNPAAPAQLQASDLAGIQSKSDHLSGFGGEQELSAYSGGPQNVLGGQAQVKPSRMDQPVAYQQAATGTEKGARGPIDVKPLVAPPKEAPPTMDANGNPVDPFTYRPLEAGTPAVPNTGTKGAGVSKDRGATALGTLQGAINQPGSTPDKPFTKEELAKNNEYNQKNDMLAGWGDDDGLDVLRQVYGPEVSQYDADIMAAGGGRTAQAELSKKYKTEGDAFKKQTVQNATDRMTAHAQATNKLGQAGAAAQGQPQALPGGGQALTPTPSAPQEVGELNNLLFNGNDQNAWSGMHAVGMTLNPADWATIGMGEAGMDVPPTTEMFAQSFDMTNGEVQKSWPQGKFLMAYKMLVHGPEYDGAPKQAFLNALKNTPGMLQEYLSMKNPGFMARNMRAWMQAWRQTQAANQPGQAQMAEQTGGAQGLAALMHGWAVDAGAHDKTGTVQSNGLGFSF